MTQREQIRRLKRAAGKVQKKLNKLKFPCLCPGCSQLAIFSHSQQKEGQLRAIAKNGLVYALNRNMFQTFKNIINGQFNTFVSKVGIHEASAFPGYCAKHDDMIFSPIEKYPLTPSNPEQAALLFLRAISLEYAVKRQMSFQMDMFTNAVASDANQQWQEFSTLWLQGIKLFLVREGPFILGQIFDIITKKEYSRLHTSWIRLLQTLPVSVSTCVCPWLNDYYDKWSPTRPQAMVTFSIIPTNTYTDVVCTWLDYCHKDSMWIRKEMDSIQGLERMINLLGIAESEDICMNMDFWESQPEELKDLVSRNIHHDFFRGPLSDIPLIIKIKDSTEQKNKPDRE